MNLFYKILAGMYDLLDIIYFRNEKQSPRNEIMDWISETDRVLDVCTGTATNAICIAKEKEGIQIIGIDLSENMLKVAKHKADKDGLSNIKLHRMDAAKLEFADEYFDKILISLVLHELEDELAGKIITEAKRVLKPEGSIIVTEWERSKSFSRKLLFMPIHILEPKSYRTFIKKDLHTYFKKYDLEMNAIKHCDYTKVVILNKSRDIKYIS